MSDLDADRLLMKGLFSQAVDAVGTQEAAAAFLGVSRQRIGQLISTDSFDNMPTLIQCLRLQKVTKQSLVFGTLAKVGVEEGEQSCAVAAAVASNTAASRALRVVHSAHADGILEPHEIEEARQSARENLAAAQRQFDEAMRLKPTLREVVA